MQVSGFTLQHVNAMERDILKLLNYNLYVTSSEWATWQVNLNRRISCYEPLPMVTSSIGCI
jgi:hypothetical protein